MKKLIITIFLTLFINSIALASDLVEINVTGSIGNTTCNVKTKNQQIDLGRWKTHSNDTIGSGVNSASNPREFSIDLECPPTLIISGQLEGNQYDPLNKFYIGLDKGDSSASGVVIIMHYWGKADWQSMVYGEKRVLIPSTVDGTNTIKLHSFYKQVDSTIKSGTANATTTITLTYE